MSNNDNNKELANYNIYTCVVTDNNDTDSPLGIKVEGPGVFDSSKQDSDLQNFIQPMTNTGSIHIPNIGDKVRVYFDKSGGLLPKYEPILNVTDNMKNILTDSQGGKNEVIFSKDYGTHLASMVSGADGINIDTGDGASLNLGKSNNISLKTSKDGTGGMVEINKNGTIVIGNESSTKREPAVLGNELVSLFNEIADELQDIADNIRLNNPGLAGKITNLQTVINLGVDKITSKNIFLNADITDK